MSQRWGKYHEQLEALEIFCQLPLKMCQFIILPEVFKRAGLDNIAMFSFSFVLANLVSEKGYFAFLNPSKT